MNSFQTIKIFANMKTFETIMFYANMKSFEIYSENETICLWNQHVLCKHHLFGIQFLFFLNMQYVYSFLFNEHFVCLCFHFQIKIEFYY